MINVLSYIDCWKKIINSKTWSLTIIVLNMESFACDNVGHLCGLSSLFHHIFKIDLDSLFY